MKGESEGGGNSFGSREELLRVEEWGRASREMAGQDLLVGMNGKLTREKGEEVETVFGM